MLMKMTSFSIAGDSAEARTAITLPPPYGLTVVSNELMKSVSVAAKRKASNRIQPPIAEYRMDCQIPRAALLAAPWVSSDRCAEASYPVIVYWVSRKPRGSTYSQKVVPLPNPELLIRSVKTNDRLWWVSGVKISTRTTIAAPNTCHQTEMLLITASRCELKMFSEVITTISTRNQKNCWYR